MRAPFICPVQGCGSTFTRQFNLKGHLRSHREGRPYVCKWPRCGKSFPRQDDCKRHEALHLVIGPSTCGGCGRTYVKTDELDRHYRSDEGMECRAGASLDDLNRGIKTAKIHRVNGHYVFHEADGGEQELHPGPSTTHLNVPDSTGDTSSYTMQPYQLERWLGGGLSDGPNLIHPMEIPNLGPVVYMWDTDRIIRLVDPYWEIFTDIPDPYRWLARVSSDSCPARTRAVGLCGEDAALFNSFAHECLSRSTDIASHDLILRLLQDVCSASGELPTTYWLADVTVNWKRRIGRGGEALVFMGMYKDRKVVVREVSPPNNKNWTDPQCQSALTLVRREIVMHAQLRHENIIPLLGVFRESDEDPPMMILPFMENGTASDYIDTLPVTDIAAATVRIIRDITRALLYLHTHNPPVLHGDLHPGNILIGSTGTAVLCDFGFSRIRHEITRIHTNIREGGNCRYLAPELSSGPDTFRTNQASDVYSLAMTYLALVTRAPPFQEYYRETGAMRAAEQGIRPNRPPCMPFPDSATDGLWSLMETMWAHEPQDRPTALQVKAQVESLFCNKP